MNTVENREALAWVRVLKKNLRNNRQLEFTGNMFVSCVGQDGDADSDMFRLRLVEDDSGRMVFAADQRSQFAQNILNSKKACVSVYFPLSKEKMKFKGSLSVVTKDTQDEEEMACVLDIWNNKLNKEDHKLFKEAKPDQQVSTPDELNTFNTPSVQNVPKNFSLLIIKPTKGNHKISPFSRTHSVHNAASHR
jgi:hypothetical protein